MKMNKKRPILRRAAIPAVLALLCTLFWFGKPNDFGLGRNMELLVNMMRELSLFYVDEVDPDQLMQDAAEGMTRNLDPYTEFPALKSRCRTSTCSPRASTEASVR